MLLEFKMKNFKSFKEEMSFKMTPAQKIKGLEYSLIKEKVKTAQKENEVKALSTAVIYGPNSSGKTNIIGGMEVYRAIILCGNIKNNDVLVSANIATNRLELIPNIESNKVEPVSFYIKFFTKGMIIEMSLAFKVGKFLDTQYNRKIVKEVLKINNDLIYERTNKLTIGKLDNIREYLIENFAEDVAEKISQSNLDNEELFFNGTFKTLYSKKIYDIIHSWFTNQFKIMYHADMIKYAPKISMEDKNKKYYINVPLNKAAKEFGLTSRDIAYPVKEDREQIHPLSVISVNNGEKIQMLPAEIFESFGTIRFLNIFPMILLAMKLGTTLIVDELDASLHPMAVMNIINIFHNNEININGAQLIFNTHNPIFLNNALLRRDEIKFVEKEENGSEHYSLSDFGTSGVGGVRRTEDYMKNYFINKYGAINTVDFSDIIYEMLNGKKEENIEEE